VLFTAVHVTMVAWTGLRRNLNHMVLGTGGSSLAGLVVTIVILALVVLLNVGANLFTWRYPRHLQHAFERTTMRLMRATLGRLRPRAPYSTKDISPYFWANGKPPTSGTYRHLLDGDFRDYRLRVYGEVEDPMELSLADLRALGCHTQTTMHNCIQGWSGIAEWTGTPLTALLDRVRPTPQARWVVFHSYGPGVAGGLYYDAHPIEQLRHPHSILAWQMNGRPLPVRHGAPLRVRNESQLGYKQVKWVQALELVRDYRTVGAGHGGYNEDHKYYGLNAGI